MKVFFFSLERDDSFVHDLLIQFFCNSRNSIKGARMYGRACLLWRKKPSKIVLRREMWKHMKNEKEKENGHRHFQPPRYQ